MKPQSHRRSRGAQQQRLDHICRLPEHVPAPRTSTRDIKRGECGAASEVSGRRARRPAQEEPNHCGRENGRAGSPPVDLAQAVAYLDQAAARRRGVFAHALDVERAILDRLEHNADAYKVALLSHLAALCGRREAQRVGALVAHRGRRRYSQQQIRPAPIPPKERRTKGLLEIRAKKTKYWGVHI